MPRHWKKSIANERSEFHVDFFGTNIGDQTGSQLKNQNVVTHEFHTKKLTFDMDIGLNKMKFEMLKKTKIEGRDVNCDNIDPNSKVAAFTPNVEDEISDESSNNKRHVVNVKGKSVSKRNNKSSNDNER